MQSLRNRRPVVLHLQSVIARRPFQAHGDDAVGRAKIDGVFDEFVEQLHEQVGRAANEARIGGRLERDVRLGKPVAIGGDRGRQQLAQIDIRAVGLLDALLDARRGAQGTQDGLQPLRALPRPRHITSLVVSQSFGLEIIQRRTHDGQRGAQLVR